MTKILPTAIDAGATFESSVTLADYPAPDWVLSAHLRGAAAINLTAAADGAGHKFTAAASTTSAWAAGVYTYGINATKGAEVRVVEKSTVTILPNLAAITTPYDGRTDARKVLDSIEAVIAKRATIDQQRYTINNRELWRTPIADLLKLRDTYRAEVRREEARARGKSLWGPAVQVRF